MTNEKVIDFLAVNLEAKARLDKLNKTKLLEAAAKRNREKWESLSKEITEKEIQDV